MLLFDCFFLCNKNYTFVLQINILHYYMFLRLKPPHTILIAVIMGVVFTTLVGCSMIEVHPYDAHIEGEFNLTEKNVRLIEERLQGKTQFKFAMISDTQRWFDETEDFVEAINERDDIDFIIHGGDIADFGLTNEFLMMRDILSKLKSPYITTIGNHDCLATGEYVYKKLFGPTNYSFTAGGVRFLGLNTNALEYDYSERVPDFTFLSNELNAFPMEVKRSIIFMHAAPGSDVFNNNVDFIFQRFIKEFPGLMFCLHGHTHGVGVKDIFSDGVLYYECPCIEKRIYLLFTINENSYEYEVVKF